MDTADTADVKIKRAENCETIKLDKNKKYNNNDTKPLPRIQRKRSSSFDHQWTNS
jgi:hypothetical protein